MSIRVLGLFENGDEGGHRSVRGDSPRHPLAYGAEFLHGDGLQLLRVEPARSRVHRKVRDVVEHRSGLAVDRTVRAARAAASADAVFAFLEREGAFASRLRAGGLWPMRGTPLLVLSCWWAEELRTGTREQRDRIRRDAAGMDRLFVLSRNQVEIFDEHGIPAERVQPLRFSVDARWCSPDPEVPRDQDVVAIGLDRGRDFVTLLEAARQLPDAAFHILTTPGRLDPASLPPNVRLEPMAHGDDYVRWLRSARVVAVPTYELAYPTGQSVLLEASAAGACVAVTDTPAMRDYVDPGRTALTMPLSDPAGVAEVLARALSDEDLRNRVGAEARRTVVQQFAYPGMWTDVREAVRELVGR